MTAYVFLAEGFEEVEALTPVDILRRGGVTVKTVGIGGKTITGAHGIPVGCDIAEEDVIPDEIDMMVLPGGMPGTIHLGESLTIQEGWPMPPRRICGSRPSAPPPACWEKTACCTAGNIPVIRALRTTKSTTVPIRRPLCSRMERSSPRTAPATP